MRLLGSSRGMISERVIKWIIALAIIVAVGFAIRGIIGKFG